MANKVLIIGQFPPPVTGEGKMNLHVLRLLVEQGFHVEMLDSCIVSSVNDVGHLTFIKLWRMVKFLVKGLWRQRTMDIIYMTPGQTLLGLLRFLPLLWLAKSTGKHVILHWHGYGVLSQFIRRSWLGRCYLDPSITNLVLTEDFRKQLMCAGFQVTNVTVVRNFSEIEVQAQPIKPHGNKLRVIFIGGLMPEKGVDVFLELASTTQSYHMALCGAGNNEITQKAQALASTGALTFHGVVDGEQKKQLMLAADVFVLQTSYLTEGVPLTILEAMACGCAILTTAHNGIPETVADAACFVEANSVNSLQSTLSYLDSHRSHLQQLQTKAFLRSKTFSAAAFEQTLLDVFNDSLRSS